MLSSSEVVEFIHNPLAYEEKLVSIINEKGEQIPLFNFNELYQYPNATIKLEGMERYNRFVFYKTQYYAKKYGHNGPVTCHAFLAKEGSPSFGLHTDPDNVIIFCLEGFKQYEVDGKIVDVSIGTELFIPAGTPHRAINVYESLVLSFGLEKFMVDKAEERELALLLKNN